MYIKFIFLFICIQNIYKRNNKIFNIRKRKLAHSVSVYIICMEIKMLFKDIIFCKFVTKLDERMFLNIAIEYKRV